MLACVKNIAITFSSDGLICPPDTNRWVDSSVRILATQLCIRVMVRWDQEASPLSSVHREQASWPCSTVSQDNWPVVPQSSIKSLAHQSRCGEFSSSYLLIPHFLILSTWFCVSCLVLFFAIKKTYSWNTIGDTRRRDDLFKRHLYQPEQPMLRVGGGNNIHCSIKVTQEKLNESWITDWTTARYTKNSSPSLYGIKQARPHSHSFYFLPRYSLPCAWLPDSCLRLIYSINE